MFITGNKKEGFQIHLNATDMEETVTAGEIKSGKEGTLLDNPNVRLTLSADKAKELEGRLEVILKQD